MSSEEEIAEVYAKDINRMTTIVYNKRGIVPFIAGFSGYNIFTLYGGTIPCSDNLWDKKWEKVDASDDER